MEANGGLMDMICDGCGIRFGAHQGDIVKCKTKGEPLFRKHGISIIYIDNYNKRQHVRDLDCFGNYFAIASADQDKGAGVIIADGHYGRACGKVVELKHFLITPYKEEVVHIFDQ